MKKLFDAITPRPWTFHDSDSRDDFMATSLTPHANLSIVSYGKSAVATLRVEAAAADVERELETAAQRVLSEVLPALGARDVEDATRITAIRYECGEANHPISPGRTVIELDEEGFVRLTHERLGVRRAWTGQHVRALWPMMANALAQADFPRRPPPGAAPPDSIGFSIACSRGGEILSVTLLPSPAYAGFCRLMTSVIAQMTGVEILGFELPAEEAYVVGVREE
ncbi:MAG TPA: hypothetical protein VIF62_22840 [Labilithrix sp.]